MGLITTKDEKLIRKLAQLVIDFPIAAAIVLEQLKEDRFVDIEKLIKLIEDAQTGEIV